MSTFVADPTPTTNLSLLTDLVASHILPLFPPTTSPAEITDFTTYLSTELFDSLPPSFQSLAYSSEATDPPSAPTDFPPSLLEELTAYDLTDSPERVLREVVEEYITASTAPPPVWSKTRTEECEICEREVPLTYHHLIPRSVHKKVLKRGWHPEWRLNVVAWLCRACHSAVHRCASNEELAKDYYTVEKLLEREDVQKWRNYIAKQRWGGKGCKKR